MRTRGCKSTDDPIVDYSAVNASVWSALRSATQVEETPTVVSEELLKAQANTSPSLPSAVSLQLFLDSCGF